MAKFWKRKIEQKVERAERKVIEIRCLPEQLKEFSGATPTIIITKIYDQNLTMTPTWYDRLLNETLATNCMAQ